MLRYFWHQVMYIHDSPQYLKYQLPAEDQLFYKIHASMSGHLKSFIFNDEKISAPYRMSDTYIRTVAIEDWRHCHFLFSRLSLNFRGRTFSLRNYCSLEFLSLKKHAGPIFHRQLYVLFHQCSSHPVYARKSLQLPQTLGISVSGYDTRFPASAHHRVLVYERS